MIRSLMLPSKHFLWNCCKVIDNNKTCDPFVQYGAHNYTMSYRHVTVHIILYFLCAVAYVEVGDNRPFLDQLSYSFVSV